MTAATLASIVPELLTVLAAALLITAALCDIAARTIPNLIPLGLAVLGLGLRVADGSYPWAVLAAGVVFGIALLCWTRGWMGGGDVKLLGACALLVPPMAVAPMITVIGIAGGVLALIYLSARRLVSPPATLPAGARPRRLLARIARAERWRLARGAALPYAVAIAVGSLISFP